MPTFVLWPTSITLVTNGTIQALTDPCYLVALLRHRANAAATGWEHG